MRTAMASTSLDAYHSLPVADYLQPKERAVKRRTLKMPPRVDLLGERFGRYVVVSYAGAGMWNCVCDCGTERAVLTSNLRRGNSTSCGCAKPEKSRAKALRHGLADTPVHRSWMSMRQRCLNPNDGAYKNYGGRGISICTRWSVFENFLADMGPMPDGYELERDNVNGNYEPSNCRWATKKEQANNKRTSLFITYQGRTQTLTMWAEELGMKPNTLYSRIVLRKMPIEKAMRTVLKSPRDAGKQGAAVRWIGKSEALLPPRAPAQASLLERFQGGQ